MSSDNYVPIHAHSTHSLRDAIIKPDNYAKKAKELGMEAASLTDHGSMSGTYIFQKACEREGIKPLLGEEAYISEAGDSIDDIRDRVKEFRKIDHEELDADTTRSPLRSHIVLLAANHKGWNNLLWLHNKGVYDRYYRKPHMTREEIYTHNDGLIVTTACLASKWAQLFEEKKDKELVELTQQFKEVFSERFFLEVQLHRNPFQMAYNNRLIELSRQLNVPLVLGLDAHFLDKDDGYAHAIARAIASTSGAIEDTSMYAMCYLQSYEELTSNARAVGIPYEAIENTKQIAAMIDFKIQFSGYHFPREDKSRIDEMVRLAYDNLAKLDLHSDDRKAYKKRLDEEVRVLKTRDILDYFVLLKDTIDYIKQQDGRLNFGRGSAAGSLFCYLTGITRVDPIQYGLMFERFLTEDRGKVEVDVDF